MPLIALVLSPALAGTVEAWTPDEFPIGRDNAVDGTDGWRAGFDDPWGGYDDRDNGLTWAYPVYDYGDAGRFGDGGAHDNWLTNDAETVLDGVFQTYVYVSDNDSWGVVVGKTGDESLLIFLFCGTGSGDLDLMSCASADMDVPGAALVELKDGRPTILASTTDAIEEGYYGWVTISLNDGVLDADFTGDDIGFSISLSTSDASITQVSGVGFYGYNEGFIAEDGQDDGDNAYFCMPMLAWYDDDDDGVVDDDDNCEFVANDDQGDRDNDGVGDVCDDDSGDSGVTDSGDPGDDDDDDDDGGGGSADGDADKDGSLSAPGSCGCATPGDAPSTGTLTMLVVGAALLRARRARSAR